MTGLSERDGLLISVLAVTDAIWLPDRQPANYRRWTLISERRRDFRSTGIVLDNLAGDGASGAERQQASRDLRALAADGYLTIHRPKWARTLAVKLTDSGDTRARSLAGLPTFDHSLLVELDGLKDSPMAMDCYDRIWLSEFHLGGVHGGPDDRERMVLVQLMERMLPCLSRGLVESNVTMHRNAWYSLTKSGQAAVAAGPPAARSEALPEPLDEATGEYYDSHGTALARLSTSPPRVPNDIGILPLPVSPPKLRPGAVEAWQAWVAQPPTENGR